MSKVDVSCKIRTYPDHDKKESSIEIKSHWNYNDRVQLIIGKEHHVVIGSDLITAAKNCMYNS